MMKSAQSTGKVRAPRWPEGLVPWRQAVESFLNQIARKLGTQIEIKGATASQGGDSDTLSFDVSGSGSGSTSEQGLDCLADGRVVAATILGVMPTIGGDRIDGSYTPLTIGSGTKYIIATVTGTPDTTTLSGRVFFHPAMSSISVAISVTATAPTAGDLTSTSGTFKIHLATFVDGRRTAQNGHGPITGFVQDQLDGSGYGTLSPVWTAP